MRGQWLGAVLGAGALAIAGAACKDASQGAIESGKPEKGQTEGSPSAPEQVNGKDKKVAPPAGAFKSAPGQDNTASVRGDSRGQGGAASNLDSDGVPTLQVAQPSYDGQPGALAGPAAQQATAAGGTPGAEVVVDGHLVERSAEALLIDAPNKHGLKVKIDDQTKFTLNGKPSTATGLIEGAEVRAAYKLKDGEPVGTRIDGTSNLGKLHPAEQMIKP